MKNKKEINSIKMLAVDAINSANSGHSGIAIGAAPILYSLFKDHLNVVIENEKWISRDRFVMSAGHGSALLYSIFHAFGFPYSINDLKGFRQIGSKTPGHPEIELPFVEMTTGPLGQGITSAVGMAISERYLNKHLKNAVNNFTYVLCGDGCLQEGQSYEAMSIAGNMNLSKLIILHDSNDIQIDTRVKEVNTENLKLRVEAMNWDYYLVEDGSDEKQISLVIKEAKKSSKPSFIEIRTIIGKDTVLQDISKIHGVPLGKENRKLFAKKLTCSLTPFTYEGGLFDKLRSSFNKRVQKNYQSWLKSYNKMSEDTMNLYQNIIESKEWDNLKLDVTTEPISTRALTKNILEQLKNKLSLIGGSADVAGSTYVKGANGMNSPSNLIGQNIPFGVREHAMAAIANGMMNYQGIKAITATFLSFADYEKPALRLAALMSVPTISIFSHDSLFVGEDGPTHQPIEQVTMLRSIPNMTVFRPYNSEEMNEAFINAITSTKPTSIVTTRQNLSNLRTPSKAQIEKGAYVFKKETKELKLCLVASGSEVDFIIRLADELKMKDNVRIVSVPSLCIFSKQPKSYQNKVVPNDVSVEIFEATNDTSWLTIFKNANLNRLTTFGESGPGKEVYEKHGFNIKKVSKRISKLFL